MSEQPTTDAVTAAREWMASEDGQRYICVRTDVYRAPENGCLGCIVKALVDAVERRAPEQSSTRADAGQLAAVDSNESKDARIGRAGDSSPEPSAERAFELGWRATAQGLTLQYLRAA